MGVNIIRFVCTFGQVGSVVLTLGGRGPLCCLFYVGGRWFCWLFGAVSFVSGGGG